jgi:hypothetical protein
MRWGQVPLVGRLRAGTRSRLRVWVGAPDPELTGVSGMAAAQLAGQDHLVGLERVRGDVTAQLPSLVLGLCSTTAVGLPRRMDAR